jgi:two-component system LytT family response regulator
LADVPWLDLVGEAVDGPGGVALIERCRPEVAFLDIAMAGLDGIELARRLSAPPLIVYTTAYTEHAVAAFAVGAVDYLVKPFGRRRLAETLERLQRALDGSQQPPPITQLLLRKGRAVVPVAVDEVVRFEGRDDFVAVHTESGRYLTELRLRDLEEQLAADKFVRIHRSHIINLGAVRQIAPAANGRLAVTMIDGTTVRSSRRRAAALRARFH